MRRSKLQYIFSYYLTLTDQNVYGHCLFVKKYYRISWKNKHLNKKTTTVALVKKNFSRAHTYTHTYGKYMRIYRAPETTVNNLLL